MTNVPEEWTPIILYPKPHILLMDVVSDVTKHLTNKGFDVSEGHFGRPYQLAPNHTVSNGYVPVLIPNNYAPKHLAEKEVVIIDLTSKETDWAPNGMPAYNRYKYPILTSALLRIADPRPSTSDFLHSDFEQIYQHGGVFIIFAGNKQYVKQRSADEDGIYLDYTSNNWGFLSVLEANYFTTTSFLGKEIITDVMKETRLARLQNYVANANCECTIDSGLGDRWVVLAKNKYDHDVAGCILPQKRHDGLILIFPNIIDKVNFLEDLLINVLPEISPDIFPYFEGTKWLSEHEYEMPAVLDLKDKIRIIEEEAKGRISVLEKQIIDARNSTQYLHDILIATGSHLVDAVAKALHAIGFHDVVDMDAELAASGEDEPKREDLQLRDRSPLLLIEVKGILGTSKDSSAIKVSKYLMPRAKKLQRTDIRGLSIINNERNKPPHSRKDNPFNEDTLETAKGGDFGLLTTWSLYKLVRSFLQLGWKHEYVAELFYQDGFIEPVPTHYKYIGSIAEFLPKAGAIIFTPHDEGLRRGDRIAFELANEFVEQIVDSMQLDDSAVEEAPSGVEIGISTTFTKAQLKVGTRIFRVQESVAELKP